MEFVVRLIAKLALSEKIDTMKLVLDMIAHVIYFSLLIIFFDNFSKFEDETDPPCVSKWMSHYVFFDADHQKRFYTLANCDHMGHCIGFIASS